MFNGFPWDVEGQSLTLGAATAAYFAAAIHPAQIPNAPTRGSSGVNQTNKKIGCQGREPAAAKLKSADGAQVQRHAGFFKPAAIKTNKNNDGSHAPNIHPSLN
jgi:hypothetical protein